MRETNDDSFPHTLETQVNALAKYKRKKKEKEKEKEDGKEEDGDTFQRQGGLPGAITGARCLMFPYALPSWLLRSRLASFGCGGRSFISAAARGKDPLSGIYASGFARRTFCGCSRVALVFSSFLFFLVHLFQWVVMDADVDAHKHTRVQFSHICILCY